MSAVRTILVVDDEEIVRDVARAMLMSRGYNVLVAESGEAAAALLREKADEISLMLLDAGRTGRSGPNMAKSLLAINPHLIVIVSSGSLAEEVLAHFDPDRISGFLQKPYTLARLCEAVSMALQKRCVAA